MESQPDGYYFSDPNGLSLGGTTLAQSSLDLLDSPGDLLLGLSQEFDDQGDSTAAWGLEPLPTAEELLPEKVFTPAATEFDPIIPDSIVQAGKRKRRAPTTKDHHWEPLKARIIELHTEEKLPVKKLMAVIQEETGFDATSVAYPAWRIDLPVRRFR